MFGRSQPPRVPTDDVLPARFFDDSPVVKAVVMRWMVRFDDVFDAEHLRRSLARLLEMGSWRRLGGRFRLNKQGKLEIHVPKVFSTERPAIRFSRIQFEYNISEHPLASRLPRPTEGPSIQEGGDVFRDLLTNRRWKFPKTLEDYLYSDEPPIALQVLGFKDATIVSLNFPHALTDAVGLSALITNWCRVLAGREDQVLPLPTVDPMETISQQADQPEEEHVLKTKKLVGFGLMMFVSHFVWDLLFGPKMETRTIFLPPKSFTVLKQRATAEFQTGSDKAEPFISEGDVLTAWGTKMVALGLGPRFTRTMAVMNVFELRGRLKNCFDLSGYAYVQNAFFTLNTILTARDAREQGIGQIALRLRNTLVEQTTEPQIRALVREQRASLTESGRPTLFAEPDSILVPFTNWNKARFFEVVDFSPAVRTPGNLKGTKGGRVGKPALFLSFDSNPKPNPTYRNVFNILGKDPEGNYWITGMLSRATWDGIEKELKSL
ncbi:hypothetical protein QBC46DRAFT_385795 [Diplogelasinospora grovesii]|uniref:Uncharacterized protein n=1 Tax=Diplogelasinospora grovesii TaxID=303347 RepID=A0AAN6N6V2_9PEZI|nr:hypothetical protein QBC46DRAFT_385795 [Diplogelasinospora grovesii]